MTVHETVADVNSIADRIYGVMILASVIAFGIIAYFIRKAKP